MACERISDRGIGYGMPGITVDGNDPLAVYQVVKEAADRGRRGEGPTLIETVCHRMTPHSSDDDDSGYRTEEERSEAKSNDPLISFFTYVKDVGVLDEQKEKEMNERVKLLVDEATDYAENAPYADPEQVYKYVYDEV
jgi:2-oxoisovalerate dehydrogenase E1 component alpha subunit